MGKIKRTTLNEVDIRAAMANPRVSEVIMPAGVVVLTTPLVGRSDLTLRGSGRNATTLKLAPNFTFPVQGNAAIQATNTARFGVTDLAIDGGKLGWNAALNQYGIRICGVAHRNSGDYDVARVATKDISGYAFWAVGTGTGTKMTRNGRYNRIRAINSNVHFEAMRAEDILVDGLFYGPGDGDMPCEAAVHPVLFGRRHTYRGVQGTGGNPGFSIVASGGTFHDIVIEDAHCVATTRAAAFVMSAQGNLIDGVAIRDSYFEAQNGHGTDIEGGVFEVKGVTFIGAHPTAPAAGLVIGGECKMRCLATIAEGRSVSPDQWSYGAINQNHTENLHFDGELRAVASGGAYGSATGSQRIITSATTLMTP